MTTVSYYWRSGHDLSPARILILLPDPMKFGGMGGLGMYSTYTTLARQSAVTAVNGSQLHPGVRSRHTVIKQYWWGSVSDCNSFLANTVGGVSVIRTTYTLGTLFSQKRSDPSVIGQSVSSPYCSFGCTKQGRVNGAGVGSYRS